MEGINGKPDNENMESQGSKKKGPDRRMEHIEAILSELPSSPGVYIMKDGTGKIIYVGKAVSLRNRVRSYFQASNKAEKVKRLVSHVADIEYIVTDSEIEALILECNLIKENSPKYNVRLKDDKSYPYIKVTVNEPFPKVFLTRNRADDGSKYYGPYTDAQVARESLRILKRIFPVRSCKKVIGHDGSADSRPCLNYHIKRCHAPCAGNISVDEYRDIVRQICLFLEGKQDELLNSLKRRMQEAAESLEFEKAAEIRDQIRIIERIGEKQKIVSDKRVDQDVIYIVNDESSTCAQIFLVREGKLVGREHFLLESALGTSLNETIPAFLKQYYSNASFIPKEILIQEDIEEKGVIEEWLKERRGSKVTLTVPARGDKRRLLEMAGENAVLLLKNIKERASQEREKTEGALLDLKLHLGLDAIPFRIEAFDISNIQGEWAVASMIVFENGRPRKSDYRRFRIKGVKGPDDYASMREVISRRFSHGLKEMNEILKTAIDGLGDTEGKEAQKGNGPMEKALKGSRFAVMPDLILIDGGKGQLNAAIEAMRSIGMPKIPIMGLAKQFEHIFIPGRKDPIILPEGSKALFLIQRIRDEAHRFAVSYHRSLREKGSLASLLDEIPGVGKKRMKALLDRFSSIEGIRDAEIEEIASIPGITEALAERIKSALGSKPV